MLTPPQRPGELVLDREAAVDKGHDVLAGSGLHGEAQKHRGRGDASAFLGEDRAGFDAKTLHRVLGLLRVGLGSVEVQLDALPATGVELAQDVEQPLPGGDVLARHLVRDEGGDGDRMVVADPVDDLEGLGREPRQPLGREIATPVEAVGHIEERADDRDQGQEAHQLVMAGGHGYQRLRPSSRWAT